MKTFLFDSLNRFRKYSKELDTMAEIRKCLCGKAWQVFNNSGDKEVYIFQEDGSLIISINGNITRGSWQYLSVNNSIAISASNQEYMVHPAFLDNILFALQVDGTENYAFLIDQKNKQNFAPQSLDDLHRYFREKEQKRIEEENRKREEQRLVELKRIEEENRKREEQLRAEQKRIEKEKKEREERERREKEWQMESKAQKIYEDEIIKSFGLWLFVAYLFVLLLACWICFILIRVYPLLAIICLILGCFSFKFPYKLIFRCRLKKFIKNNRTYSTDMLYRLVKCHNYKPTSFDIGKLSYYEFKKLILDQIPTNEIHYTTKDNRFLSLSLSGVQILSHLYYQDMNLFIVTFDKDVTKIGESAFSECSSLTSIIIPESVTEIGDSAFLGCKSLTSITIPPSVREIWRNAFYGCSNLTSITVSKENKFYDSRENCNALIHTESNTLISGCKNTIIPASVTKIGKGALSGCSSLTSITIPPSVTEIGNDAFYGCSSLTSISVSKDNKVYDSREDCNAIIHTKSNTLISGCKNTIIPPSVTEIGGCAFRGCSSLTSITIPPSVKKIGDLAFSYCSNITSIAVSKDNKVYDSREGCNAIIHTKSNTLISGCKNTIIPTSVKEIGHSAFNGCSSLTSIFIPPSVTKIGEGAFSDCSSLTSIAVSKDNKVYDSRKGCNAIIHTESNTLISGCKNTIIPTSITQIREYAFWGCSSLTSISIPPSVTEIGEYAFWRCSSLTSISIPSSVTEIGEYAFWRCSSLTSISIPPSVTEIGEYAFGRCSSLTSISIPSSVTKIGVHAFRGCSSLTSITIPPSVTEIGNSAFSCCFSLTSISIPPSVTKIGKSAFYDCSSLKSISIPPSVKEIGEDAFRGCSSLKSISIPPSVTKIGDWAFDGCSSLTSISIPESVTKIGYAVFSGCSSLTSITIPPSVTEIGESAFYGCYSLTSITIPPSVTKIGYAAFSGCYRLTSITIPPSVTKIRGWTFSGCFRLTEVRIPKGCNVHGNAFGICTKVKIIRY